MQTQPSDPAKTERFKRQPAGRAASGGRSAGETSRTAARCRFYATLLWFCLLAVLVSGGDAAAQQSDAGDLSVTGPCRLQFPQDHRAHPGFRTEWWYYTGNLQTARRRRFGFQLTIFRRRIRPPAALPARIDSVSRWRTRQIYLGHAAVTDIGDARHLFAETAARGALGLAGVRQSDGRTTVFVNKWSVDIRPGFHRLQADTPDFSIDLQLHPDKPPVLHGDRGYSRKGDGAERASCYYSFTRLETVGTIRLGEKAFALSGSSWMDHEYSTASLQPGISGWDWFSLQLNNGTDVMIYLLRREDGTFHPASSGTLIEAGDEPVHLTAFDLVVEAVRYWQSPRSKATYPSGWKVRVNEGGIDIAVEAALADQELQTGATTGVTYWEGSVVASGTARGKPVAGRGYVELTGYAGGMEALK